MRAKIAQHDRYVNTILHSNNVYLYVCGGKGLVCNKSQSTGTLLYGIATHLAEV
jgi:hypothetical protein